MSAVIQEERGDVRIDPGWQRHIDGDVHGLVERLSAETDAKAACPVRTGRLRDSTQHEVDDGTVRIRSDVSYVGYVEEVTCSRGADPVLRPRLFRVRSL
ncbi:MAG: hypothetical protein ACRDTD_08970 [Pseudonocardiaceae bacterium]